MHKAFTRHYLSDAIKTLGVEVKAYARTARDNAYIVARGFAPRTMHGTRGKTPGKEEDRQMPCDYGALLKSNFVFCKIYLMEQITSVLHYSPIQNCCQR